jgi:hypothetical protein
MSPKTGLHSVMQGARKLVGDDPNAGLRQVFNFKLGFFYTLHSKQGILKGEVSLYN